MALDVSGGKPRALPARRASRHTTDQQGEIGRRPLVVYGRHALGRYVRKLRKHRDDLHAEDNVEAIHDVRVAIRGLRAMLGMLEEAPGFDDKELRKLRRGLRWLARLLGEVRDLDVLLARVRDDAAHLPEAAGLAPLAEELAHHRTAANKRLLKELDRPRTARLLDDALRLSRTKDGWGRDAPGGGTVLVRHFAGSAIWRRYEEVLAFEGAMPDADDATLHQLRIACKHLRYVLEPFTDDGHDPHPLVALLQDVQKRLGASHDVVTAIAEVEQMGASSPDNTALLAYRHHLEAERERLRADVPALWKRLSGTPMRRDLAGFIACL